MRSHNRREGWAIACVASIWAGGAVLWAGGSAWICLSLWALALVSEGMSN